MKKAFVHKTKRTLPGWVIPVLIFVVTAAVIITGINNLSRSQTARQLEAAQRAVIRATVLCYALEGRYPPSLDYLADNYGVTLYPDRYFYHYVPIAENLMPEIAVLPVKAEG